MQRRHPKGSKRGGQFAPAAPPTPNPVAKTAAQQAAAREVHAVRNDVEAELGVEDLGAEDMDANERHPLEISGEEREELHAKTETYLAELRSEVGEPSEKHRRRARALVESIKRAQREHSSA